MTKGAVAGRQPMPVEVVAGKDYFWCACGQSKNQPFCDGSHKGSDFRPLMWKAEEGKDYFWCACGQSKNQPFCDGSHKALPAA